MGRSKLEATNRVCADSRIRGNWQQMRVGAVRLKGEVEN